jgi:hypothetical protein
MAEKAVGALGGAMAGGGCEKKGGVTILAAGAGRIIRAGEGRTVRCIGMDLGSMMSWTASVTR